MQTIKPNPEVRSNQLSSEAFLLRAIVGTLAAVALAIGIVARIKYGPQGSTGGSSHDLEHTLAVWGTSIGAVLSLWVPFIDMPYRNGWAVIAGVIVLALVSCVLFASVAFGMATSMNNLP
jgi:hypothetical protein